MKMMCGHTFLSISIRKQVRSVHVSLTWTNKCDIFDKNIFYFGYFWLLGETNWWKDEIANKWELISEIWWNFFQIYFQYFIWLKIEELSYFPYTRNYTSTMLLCNGVCVSIIILRFNFQLNITLYFYLLGVVATTAAANGIKAIILLWIFHSCD
jgi:hypothetical protein